jgi:hypothetical protein
MVGLLGRVISPSQGLYLHRKTQHRKTRTNIHDLSGIRTHDPSNQPAKTHASDRTVTVTSFLEVQCSPDITLSFIPRIRIYRGSFLFPVSFKEILRKKIWSLLLQTSHCRRLSHSNKPVLTSNTAGYRVC